MLDNKELRQLSFISSVGCVLCMLSISFVHGSGVFLSKYTTVCVCVCEEEGA